MVFLCSSWNWIRTWFLFEKASTYLPRFWVLDLEERVLAGLSLSLHSVCYYERKVLCPALASAGYAQVTVTCTSSAG